MWTERGPIQEPTTSQPEESIMATTESLHLSLDNANAEIQRLEAENQKLHEDHLERAQVVQSGDAGELEHDHAVESERS